MNELQEIFPTLIYETEFENFDKIQNEIYNAVMPYFNDIAGNDDYFSNGKLNRIIRTATFDLHKEEKIKPVVDFINQHAKKYWEACNFHTNVAPYITQMWSVLTEKDGFTAPHTHNPLPISGAFYVNATSNSGDLFLENPLEIVLGKQPLNLKYGPTIFTKQIQIKPGKLVMFPGWLRHHSKANNTDYKRMCISFNYGANIFYG